MLSVDDLTHTSTLADTPTEQLVSIRDQLEQDLPTPPADVRADLARAEQAEAALLSQLASIRRAFRGRVSVGGHG